MPRCEGVIDRGRRRGKGVGRFLILGSASVDLLRQSSESLAGRIESLELMPLSLLEIEDSPPARDSLWLRGGFPQSWLAASDGDSLVWRRNFIRTYLERDIPQFGPRVPATTLERLWTMLAHKQGTLLNVSTLARALEISARSVGRYIDLFVDLMLLRRLPPLHENVGKRLVKSPKTYVRDSGLVHSLLGIPSLEELSGNPVIGESWEGFVIETLLGQLSWPSRASFYRTVSGAEVDLVLDFAKRSALGHRNQAFAVGQNEPRVPSCVIRPQANSRFCRPRGRRALSPVENRGGDRRQGTRAGLPRRKFHIAVARLNPVP